MKINGHLYGHYDSRGGAILAAVPDRETADKIYIAAMGWHEDPWFKENPEELTEAIDEDYLGTAELETAEQPEEGYDLEYGPPAEVDPGSNKDKRLWVKEECVDGDCIKDGINHYELAFATECPEGYTESILGEDACGVLFYTKLESVQ